MDSKRSPMISSLSKPFTAKSRIIYHTFMNTSIYFLSDIQLQQRIFGKSIQVGDK